MGRVDRKQIQQLARTGVGCGIAADCAPIAGIIRNPPNACNTNRPVGLTFCPGTNPGIVASGLIAARTTGVAQGRCGSGCPCHLQHDEQVAAGIADTYVLTQLAELTGLGVSIAVQPFVNSGLADSWPFQRSMGELRAMGIKVLFGEGGFVPHPPRTGGQVTDSYPRQLALDAVKSAK